MDRASNPPETPSQESTAPWRSAAAHEPQLERLHGGIPIQCQFCVGQTFRRSRLRAADLPDLLLMRYPVRCTRCAQRQVVSFTVAGISAPSYMRRRDSQPSAGNSSGEGARS